MVSSMMSVKKAISIIPILLLYVFGGGGNTAHPAPQVPPAAEDVRPVYQWDTMTARNQYTAEDGTELMYYSYQLLTLSVPNLEELPAGAAETARHNVDNFNSKMTSLMDESVEVGQVMMEDVVQLYSEQGAAGIPFYDETSATCQQTGDILNVRVSGSSYAGGAHPNRCDVSYLFDLRSGQFIDPTQIADKPEAFRSGAAALLVEKAEALEEYRAHYWSDYAEIIEHWNEGTVLFDEDGMLVVYSPYLLGPYSMGEVELRLSYDELADLIGPGGLERLAMERVPD